MTKLDYNKDIRDFDFDFFVDMYEDLYKENGEKYEYFPSKKELIAEVYKFARETYADKFDVFFFDSYDDDKYYDEPIDYATMSLVPNLYSDYMEYYPDETSSRFEWGDDERSYKIGFNIGGYIADKLGLTDFTDTPTWGDWECIADWYLLENHKDEYVGKSFDEQKRMIQEKLEEIKKYWQETEQKAIAEIELLQSKEFEQSFYDHMADYIDSKAILYKKEEKN